MAHKLPVNRDFQAYFMTFTWHNLCIRKYSKEIVSQQVSLGTPVLQFSEIGLTRGISHETGKRHHQAI
jgi:hypothetical protein